MSKYFFASGKAVIAVFGEPKIAQRKTRVTWRTVKAGGETFSVQGGTLTANTDDDFIVIPLKEDGTLDTTKEYPCKKDIFVKTWTATETNGVFKRSALNRVIQVPQGNTVTLKTLEGDETITHPDWIAIGSEDEVYSNGDDWVKQNLEFC